MAVLQVLISLCNGLHVFEGEETAHLLVTATVLAGTEAMLKMQC